jgi:hypothetical protein
MNYYYEYPETEQGSIRYFLVGEYGTETKRAHYHAIMFGVDPHRAKKITKLSWSLGHIQCDAVRDGGIQYVCGYTLKKLTSEKDFPDGQEPEFSLKSTKPALGHKQIPAIAKILAKHDIRPNFKSWDNWLLKQESIEYGIFHGILGSKRHLRLDKPYMQKLLEYMNTHDLEYATKLDDHHVVLPKPYKIHQSRLHHDSYLAKMSNVRDGTNEETNKKASKQFRQDSQKKSL